MRDTYRVSVERLDGRWFGVMNHFVDGVLIKQQTVSVPPWELTVNCPECKQPLKVQKQRRSGETYYFVLICEGPHNTGRVGPKEGDGFSVRPPRQSSVQQPAAANPPGMKPAEDPRVRRGD